MLIDEKCQYSKYTNMSFTHINLKFDTIQTKIAMGFDKIILKFRKILFETSEE